MGGNPCQMSEDDDLKMHNLEPEHLNHKSANCSIFGESQSPSSPDEVLDNVLENVLLFLTSGRDRNAVSLVCKSWHRIEALTRSILSIGNCYAVSPHRTVQRFPRVRCLALKGKPRFADFNMMPPNWGAHFTPWVTTMASAYPNLEKVYLKRMDLTNGDLAVLAQSFPFFKELSLVCCEGFGTLGLSFIAEKCRQLRVLDLTEDEVNDDEVDWISHFPESQTFLESLSFDCVESSINFVMLERLVTRSPSLRKLRLNRHISIEQMHRLMICAPHLTHLGTGSFCSNDALAQDDKVPDYSSVFVACGSLICLSGFREITPEYLPVIYPACANLTSLNFSYTRLNAQQLKLVVHHCIKLQTLLVLDSVCDEGLEAVASSCKELRELRVFPLDVEEHMEGPVSYIGLQAISEGCRKLEYILYFCQSMTNEAVIATSLNCPDLLVFRLCIMGRQRPDHLTGYPMDDGFGSIVMNCKKLTRLAVSGLLTDRAFNLIGRYGKLVRTLSVAFAGDSDIGLKYVLEGCPCLQKLEIRDSPFGDASLRSGLHHYYNMRFLWMSSCRLTHQGCKEVASALPRLCVEVIETGNNEEEMDSIDASVPDPDPVRFVDILYMYRSLEGPRKDAPDFVTIL